MGEIKVVFNEILNFYMEFGFWIGFFGRNCPKNIKSFQLIGLPIYKSLIDIYLYNTLF